MINSSHCFSVDNQTLSGYAWYDTCIPYTTLAHKLMQIQYNPVKCIVVLMWFVEMFVDIAWPVHVQHHGQLLIGLHDDVIKWKHFPRYWPFMRGIHRSPVNSPHKGQWRGALMFSLFCARINGWVNNREAGNLRSHCAHYDVIVM